MPKFRVHYIETFEVNTYHTVTAKDADEAEALAHDLQCDSDAIPTVDDFVEFEHQSTKQLPSI